MKSTKRTRHSAVSHNEEYVPMIARPIKQKLQRSIKLSTFPTVPSSAYGEEGRGEIFTSAVPPITHIQTQVSNSKRRSSILDNDLRQLAPWIRRGWWWWGEIGALLLHCVCMSILVYVLLELKGKPLEQWTRRYSISSNAVVSLLTTVAKGSMMLPVAACVSQLKWLYFERPRQLQHLQKFDDASRGPLGSLKFLFSLGSRSHAIRAGLGAMITLTAIGFEPSAQQILSYPSRMANNTGNGTAVIDRATVWQATSDSLNSGLLEIESALLNGVTGSNMQNITTVCSNTACYFSDFTSLAMCSECQDISDAVNQSCRMFNSTASATCVYQPQNTYYQPVTMPLVVHNGNRIDNGELIGLQHNVKDVGSTITTVNLTGYPKVINDTFFVFPSPTQVHACNLTYCVQRFTNVTILNGLLNYSVSSKPLYMLEKTSAEYYSMSTEPDGPPTYIVDWATSNLVLDSLPFARAEYSTSSCILDESLLGFVRSRGIVSIMDNVARQMTSIIMSGYNLNATQMYGTPMQSEVYVYVRWPWLLLPFSLTHATSVLLILTMISSGTKARVLLKSSSLALLFYELKGWRTGELHIPSDAGIEDFEDVAKGMKAVLTYKGSVIRRFTKFE